MEDDHFDIPPNPNHLVDNSSDEDGAGNNDRSYSENHYRRKMLITSFSFRRGPLRPSPTKGLLFDIRTLPNPSKKIRDAYSGASKQFREAFMADSGVRHRLENIIATVQAYLAMVEQEAQKKERIKNEAPRKKNTEEVKDKTKFNGTETKDEEREKDEEEEEEENVELRVGICCEHGRHRSVAFVEELAKVKWPDEWKVEIEHRDMNTRRSEKDKEKRPKKFSNSNIDES